jgi:SAM-dependent methyltransferase
VLERHRLLWLFLQRHTDLWQRARPARLLHFAPEKDFRHRLAAIPSVRYFSTDLAPARTPSAMTDITAMGFRDRAFDVLVCSHVMEHIPDDRAAMRECWRILEPGGWLTVQVPLSTVPTDEDLSVTDPTERETRFGQDDHVRMYGPDIVDRLSAAGFTVTLYPRERVLMASDGDVGIPPTEPPIICCRRPA